jgi:hypothetical protein
MRSESYSFIWQPNVRMKSLRATGGKVGEGGDYSKRA